ncbi:MAG TPA: pantoate--beta-alanine ligase [Gemmatimonadales bacterium]|nr:pantoate--beta-alanine ligase [Gemmatimonadales bacterium]
MLEATAIGQVRAWRRARAEEGRRVALVPTMGALHEGHLALVDSARRLADAVAMSIFVNPLQFAPTEDLARYPRNLARDRALARDRGVDLLFVPDGEEMYPDGAAGTRILPGASAERWEGAVRPGHFAGVLTVVGKLFHIFEPDVACFGQKDIQQFTLIRQMVRDLDWRVRLERVPTVREPDGLALSSRNLYLDETARAQAAGLSAALFAARTAFAVGERRAERLLAAMHERLAVFPGVSAEYIAVVEPEQLRAVDIAEPGTIVAMAARVGTTRLIDNVILGGE